MPLNNRDLRRKVQMIFLPDPKKLLFKNLRFKIQYSRSKNVQIPFIPNGALGIKRCVGACPPIPESANSGGVPLEPKENLKP